MAFWVLGVLHCLFFEPRKSGVHSLAAPMSECFFTFHAYCIGEKGAGSRILLSCVRGLTEPLGGQTPCSRVSARICRRSSKLLYAHTWMKLLSPPYSEYQQPANGENFSRSVTAAPHASSTCGHPLRRIGVYTHLIYWPNISFTQGSHKWGWQKDLRYHRGDEITCVGGPISDRVPLLQHVGFQRVVQDFHRAK